jgi:hypothetical protein
MPARHDRDPAAHLHGADAPAAEHPRLPPAQHAGGAGAHRCRARSTRSSTSTATPAAAPRRRRLAKLEGELDALNVRVMIAADNMSGDALQRAMALINASPTMKDRVRILTGIDFSNVGPGWAERAVKQLEADVAAGAVGIGEIGKGLGSPSRRPTARACASTTRRSTPSGRRRRASSCPCSSTPPIRRSSGSRSTYKNERWLELALFPNRRIRPTSSRASSSWMRSATTCSAHPRTPPS